MTWQRVKVGDLGRIVTGKTPKTADKDNYGGHIMFVTPSDDLSVKYVYSTVKTITEKGKQSVKGAILPAGSVCVSCIGSDLGKVVVTTEECVTNQQINSIIVDTEKYDIDFIYYAMLILGKELNFHSKTSTAVPIVNKSSFSSYEINCPSLKEQKKIASILSAIDGKIEKNKEINENLEEQAQALINNMIGAYSISDITDELSILPTNWQYHTLESITSQVKPGTNYQPKRISQGIPFLNVKCISTGYIDTSDAKLISEADYSRVHKTWQPEAHDLLISRIGTLGLVAVIREEDLPLAVHYNFIEIKPKTLPYEAMYFLLKSKGFQMAYHGLAKQSVQEYVTIDEVASLQIPLPDDITLFSDTLVPLYKLIENNQRETKQLVQLRDSLLPRLLSGELDVSDLDL